MESWLLHCKFSIRGFLSLVLFATFKDYYRLFFFFCFIHCRKSIISIIIYKYRIWMKVLFPTHLVPILWMTWVHLLRRVMLLKLLGMLGKLVQTDLWRPLSGVPGLQLWGRAWSFAFLTRSQLLLLVWEPHLESRWRVSWNPPLAINRVHVFKNKLNKKIDIQIWRSPLCPKSRIEENISPFGNYNNLLP